MAAEEGFEIKKLVVVTAFVVAAGCTSNDSTDNQMTQNQAKVETHAGHTGSTTTLTQASSISTAVVNKSSITVKQAPYNPYEMDWFGTYDPPAPDQRVNPQQPAHPQWVANPQLSADPSQISQQVLDLVNQERKKAGLKPLGLNTSLSKMAMDKAQDMINNNYFDHQSPTYGSPFDMMRAYGITYHSAGENIAKGQTSATEVMNQWMNSPGHRANILSNSFTQIGIGYYNGAWVQEFIS